ncbi:unnamed protein product [Clavelina lepadiformis]|uniref:Superoxide dismutase copper/zinc binding domain-containing protein n=1 Tax=Clavelina lepadiformis TaxID=159417 RepID=A0ABP0FWS3_CLALP
MKSSVFLCLTLCVAIHAHDDEVHYDFAHCTFEALPGSHICFRKENAGVQATINILGLTPHLDYKMHVHKGTASTGCPDVGPHYNLPETPEDEGDLGSFSSDGNGLVFKCGLQLHDNLSLDSTNPIIGKSVAIHIEEHRKICCNIEASTEEKNKGFMKNDGSPDSTLNCPE